MCQENWGQKPYPPLPVDVLDRKVISETTDPKTGQVVSRREKVWLRGTQHAHLGQPIKGYTGPEVEVDRIVDLRTNNFRTLRSSR